MGDEADTVRDLFKSGSLVFAGFVVENGVAFLAKLFVVRNLEKFDFGVVALGIAFLTTTAAVATLGVNKGIGRYLPRYDDEARLRGVVRSGFEIIVPVSVVIAAASAVLAGPVASRFFDAPSAAPVFRIFAVALPFAVVGKLALGSIMGSQRTAPKIWIQNIAMPVVRFGAVGVAIALGARAVGIALAYSVPYVVGALLGLYFVRRYVSLRGDYVPIHRTLLRFSAPLALASIMGTVLSDVDTFLLGALADPTAVADYDVVYTLANVLMIFLMSFGYLFLPRLSELHADGETEQMQRLYRTVTKWMGLSMLPFVIGLALFPELAISVTFGERYVSAATTLRILAVAFAGRVLVGPNTRALTSLGRSDYILYTNVAMAALNVLLNLLLIPSYGIEGAAVATLFSYLSLNALKSARLYLDYGLSPVSESLVRPLVVSTGLSLLVYVFVVPVVGVSTLSVGALFVVCAACYPAVIVATGGVEREEMVIIESVEDRFGLNLGPVKRLFDRLV